MSSRLNNYLNSTGACGRTVNQQMGTMANANAAFSTMAWESSKQEGMTICPASRYPQWPPRFTYPTLQKGDTEVLGACPGALSATQASYVQQAESVLEQYPYSYQGAAQYKAGDTAQYYNDSTSSDALMTMSASSAKRAAEWLLNSSVSAPK